MSPLGPHRPTAPRSALVEDRRILQSSGGTRRRAPFSRAEANDEVAKTLLIYHGIYGHTRKISEAIRDEVIRLGGELDIVDDHDPTNRERGEQAAQGAAVTGHDDPGPQGRHPHPGLHSRQGGGLEVVAFLPIAEARDDGAT